jgi:anthranilate synthase/aminodeoxychorismate synthase-like glutamine amidotransferase
MKPRVLLVDNYDSFTHNLYQLLCMASAEVRVERNDAITLAEIEAWAPSHIVISPGPGHPERERDLGIGRSVLRQCAGRIPILGVCLGHQALAHVAGGRVVRAPEPKHGKTDVVLHGGEGLFAGLPSPLTVMRYHSLVVEEASLPATLRVTARTPCGVVMGLQHASMPLAGVQFHPESIGTPDGPAIVDNFLTWRAA